MTKKFWAGFVSGHLDMGGGIDSYGTYRGPIFFTNRADARKRYEDVRRVLVTFEQVAKDGDQS